VSQPALSCMESTPAYDAGMDMAEMRASLGLLALPEVGPHRHLRLLEVFGTARAALAASPSAWAQVLGRGPARAARACTPDEQWIDGQIRALDSRNVHLLGVTTPGYPELLRHIAVPPPLLFTAGPGDLAAPGVAIVGTRRASEYGRGMARRLARDLAAAGICVVSGMARGIDTAAHQGALEAGGATIAVLGCGVDVVYPRQNRRLHSEIMRTGAVVSELAMGTGPEPGSFPRRNRVISGLTLGVVIVEAPLKSGALITASCALEQGRDVFAVPGDVIDGRSAGCHRLLKEGARLVEGVKDVVDELAARLPPDLVRSMPGEAEGARDVQLGLEESALLARLEARGRHIDDLARESGLGVGELLDHLLRLELMGLVKQLPGKRFCRKV